MGRSSSSRPYHEPPSAVVSGTEATTDRETAARAAEDTLGVCIARILKKPLRASVIAEQVVGETQNRREPFEPFPVHGKYGIQERAEATGSGYLESSQRQQVRMEYEQSRLAKDADMKLKSHSGAGKRFHRNAFTGRAQESVWESRRANARIRNGNED
jgi:hypothetical protein